MFKEPTDKLSLTVTPAATHLAFRGDRLVAQGSLGVVVRVLHSWSPDQRRGALLFEIATGRVLDVDLRGSAAQLATRYPLANPHAVEAVVAGSAPEVTEPVVRKRGRPKLGVVGREVTLLPRHWEWLDTQRGGASATLRRLIDQARKELADDDAASAAQDRTKRLLTTLAINLPGFEEAIRALYARDQTGFDVQVAGWSSDLRLIAKQFASGAWRR